MTADEATEILKTVLGYTEDDEPEGIIKATQLGIEALELYYELRQCTAIDVEDIPVRLPGETEGNK